MAGLPNADPLHPLSVDTPSPIPKDMQGFDTSVPLSPQWLLPKLGDNKLGLAAREPHPHEGKHADPAKAFENVEDLSATEKKKDVFRPSFHATEKGRRDRWGDEERETNSVIRRDFQREGEELKLERRSNTASKYSGEARRFPSERRTDSGSRESAYEPRRDVKWNTSWGRDDKESEKRREKWSGKDGESSHDKGNHHPSIHSKDINNPSKDTDKEGELYRLRRSPLVVNRGKGETGPYFPSTTNKPAPMFGHGRGKVDGGAPAFFVDRGRVGSSASNASGGPPRHFPSGTALDRSNGSHRDPNVLRYSRMKLLDICRTTDLKGYKMSFEWFQEFPSLMQADPLMPLSLTAPTAEELFILEAIDKGDILSGGVPLASKDGSSGKKSVDSGLLLPTKSGIGEDGAPVVNDHRDERTGYQTKDLSYFVDSVNTQKEMTIEARNSRVDSPSHLGGYPPQWQDGVNLQSDPRIRRQPSETIEQDGGEGFTHVHGQGDPSILGDKLTDRKPQQYPSPEHLILFYKDPQGQIQGPFSGSNLIEWFDAGYFGNDLLVRLADAPADTPFSLLGDVIPQLRTRVRPPPGFGLARQNDIVEVTNRGKFGGPSGNIAANSNIELMKNGQVLWNESKVQAENQFLESLMSGRISSSLSDNYLMSEGMQGRPSLGIENTNIMKFLPQKLPLEQQSPSPSPYRLGRESAIGEFPIPPKVLPQIGEVPRHIPQSFQHMDLLSILQSAADKAPPTPINSASPLWPSFPEVQSLINTHGSLDITKDSFDLHPNHLNPQSGFGTLPTMLQPQFQPPLSNQTPVAGLPSGSIPPEKLVASEFNQDAHMLNILRQQYMLAQQLNSQVPLPSHLNQMELLLLIQRQQQEQQQNQLLLQRQQQQNQLLMQQQQQHFLSQPLSGYNLYKHNSEPSSRPLSAEFVHESASSKSSIIQMHEVAAQSSRQMHVLDSNDSNTGAQEARNTVGIEHSPLNLLNQFINLAPHSNAMDAPLLDVGLTQTFNVDQMASIPDIVSFVEGHAQEAFVPRLSSFDVGTSEASHELPQTNENLTVAFDAVDKLVLSDNVEGILDSKPSVSEMIDGVKSSGTILEQARSEAPEFKGVQDAEQCEVKKISEKKSRKHKNSQLRAAAECGKGSVKAAPGQKSKINSEIGGVEKDAPIEAAEPLYRTTLEAGCESCAPSLMESLDSHGGLFPSGTLDKITKADEAKDREGEFVLPSPNNQAWKPVPGQKKTKPLVEIQVEEQRRARTQSLAADYIPEIFIPRNVSSVPLAGSSINSDQKYTVDTVQCDSLGQATSENPVNRQNLWNFRNISQFPDVLDKEVLPKVSGVDDNICSEEKCTSSHTLPQMGAPIEAAMDNDDFIEAKETRKSRKKAAKNKGVAVNPSLPNNSAVLSVSSASTPEPTKATSQIQQDKDLLPSPPSAPSLGDFLFWKGDQTSTIPSPAWSTDSIKLQQPTILRDIFKEQGKKKAKSGQQQSPIPTPAKVLSSKGSGGSSSSPLVPISSPSKVSIAPTKASSLGLGEHKTGTEDDFFWAPLKQSKEGSRSDFPSLANNPSNQNVKGAPPVKGVQGEGSIKKASSSKPVEHSITSSPAISKSLSKGKKDVESKYSEAMGFRNWCEGEWLRLTGTNDTSFLEFCLTQPTTEAASLLRENLVSLDHNHVFIDKFINYMEFLSSEIIEIAFQSRKSSKTSSENQLRASHETRIPRNVDAEADGVEGSNKGKKKGKKGKKLNSSLLGFNVVSNRIMMGEIQTIED